ncbi:FAD binding domain-containing protein [Pelosinus sp. sgz500959]|uniref:FAD binding domain-containing protein n=1 Tax=Pelosinus sp. sgz500959 TaxID=3242472 RepID=UPI00366CC2DE
MFTLLDLVQPDTIDEAYQILMAKRNNAILGGCAFLRLGSSRIGTGIELSKLNLNYITEQTDYIEIGAMTTFRDLETNLILQEYFNGVLPKAVGNIIGVQFRNVVTVGASVYAKYGFSDLITALLALDTEVELYKGGRMPLVEFLGRAYEKDFLTKIFIKKDQRKVAYQNFRSSASDFPILNVAVSKADHQWIIAVGAMPSRAKIAYQASAELSKGNLKCDDIAAIAADELVFGTNAKATGEYRKAISKVLITRAIQEVLQWK